jgi:hypothetical protein
MKQLSRWEANAAARYKTSERAHAQARREAFEAQSSSVAQKGRRTKDTPYVRNKPKRNPNAKRDLIDLIRRNEIANWQKLSDRGLSKAAAEHGVSVSKSTAATAKKELLNGH